jgi:hypothetical protein
MVLPQTPVIAFPMVVGWMIGQMGDLGLLRIPVTAFLMVAVSDVTDGLNS